MDFTQELIIFISIVAILDLLFIIFIQPKIKATYKDLKEDKSNNTFLNRIWRSTLILQNFRWIFSTIVLIIMIVLYFIIKK